MSHTLTISDGLYGRLKSEAKRHGLSTIEQLLTGIWNEVEDNLRQRQETVRRIDALHERLVARYGMMNDSADLLREDRGR